MIYECKVCFNMFRSLANLIAHKRSFCRGRSKNIRHVFSKSDEDDGRQSRSHHHRHQDNTEKVALVHPEPVDTVLPEEKFELEKYSPSIELLNEAGILAEIEERPIVNSLLPTTSNKGKSKLSSIVKSLRQQQEEKDESESIDPIILEEIKHTKNAVFQVKNACFFKSIAILNSFADC